MTKIRVLFVDDEELILKGLRRLLRGFRKEWDVEFALGGVEALQKMGEAPFDVVVSDMRMPGMNGNELLAKVKELYPASVRIILSGHADHGLILESTCLAHQYLSKPCTVEGLRAAIDKCRYLHSLLLSDELSKLVSGLSSIPSLPNLYLEVVSILEDEGKGLVDVGEVVEQDLGMSVKVLQLVNSAFFGLQRQMSKITDAVGYLGSSTMKSLVLSVKIFSELSSEVHVPGFSVQSIADKGFRCGFLAQRLAKESGASEEVVEHALLAGSLHDLGELILALNLPDQFSEVLELAKTEGMDLPGAEAKLMGSTHAEVGAYLLNLWGIAQPIVEAVAFHHNPQDCPSDELSALAVVHAAIALDEWVDSAEGDELPEEGIPGLDMEYLKRVGALDRLEAWADIAKAVGGGV